MEGPDTCNVRISCKDFSDREYLCTPVPERFMPIKIVCYLDVGFFGDAKLTKRSLLFNC